VVIDHVLRRLQDAGMLCTAQNNLPHGVQLRLANGAVVNIYKSGKVLVHGDKVDEVRRLLGLDSGL